MFIRVTMKSNGKKTVRIMEPVWIQGKCVQKTVRSMGIFENDYEIKKVQKLAEEFMVNI